MNTALTPGPEPEVGAVFRASFTITVTDTVTGESKEYVNPSGTFGSRGDTQAF